MSVSIAAKPTRYCGVQYRSRLEASWAVFWNCLTSVWENFGYDYELFSTSSGTEFTEVGTEFFGNDLPSCEVQAIDRYTPDFRLHLRGDDSSFVFFQEVKPVYPNDEFVFKLRCVSWGIGHNGYSLLLTTGGFRDEEPPSVYRFPYHHKLDFLDWLYAWCGSCNCCAEGIEAASTEAKNMRWDLYRE